MKRERGCVWIEGQGNGGNGMQEVFQPCFIHLFCPFLALAVEGLREVYKVTAFRRPMSRIDDLSDLNLTGWHVRGHWKPFGFYTGRTIERPGEGL